jgi:TolB-like protein/tetratricopeptide (TPR) repeat protein
MRLIQELKRRNVYRVGIAYLAASWVALQLADVVLENLDLPGWTFRALLAVIVIGFPIALALAWAFELTPNGVRRDARADETQAVAPASAGQYVQLAITAILAIAVGVLVVDKFRSGADSSAPATLERSVVVLPFDNISANDDDALFVDGMHDYLLTQLARLSTLDKVIARLTAETYRDSQKPLGEIAAELGVATVLTGGFQRAGENVRINMQLTRADTGKPLWANTWDRRLTLENLFATQTDISREVVEALQGALSQQDENQLAEQPTADPGAWRAYSEGRTSLARRTAPDLRNALESFERAVGIDPDFVMAWAGIADAHSLLTDYDNVSIEESIAPRRRAIDRALSLDPVSGEALTALAELRADQGDSVAAEEYFRQAIIQAPHYAPARHWYSLLLRSQGRLEQALQQISRARDIDPEAAILIVAEASILISMGDYEAADRTLADGIRRHPDFQNLYASRGDLFVVRGQLDEALRWRDEAVRLSPSSADTRESQCAAQAELALLDMATSCVEALAADFPSVFVAGLSGTDLAIHVQQGRIEDFLLPAEHFDQLPERAVIGMGSAYFLANRIDAARTLYESVRPDLFASPPHPVASDDITNALVAAGILTESGETELARELVAQVEATLAEFPGAVSGSEFTPTIIALSREDYATAAETLLTSTESGAIQSWWIFLAPRLARDMEDPGFAEAFAAVRAEIERQREAYLANPARKNAAEEQDR